MGQVGRPRGTQQPGCSQRFLCREDYAVLEITSKQYGIHEFFVDLEDVPRLARSTWFVNYCPRTQYFSAQCKKSHQEKIGLKELVLGISINTHHQVLHRNGNRYDCRKSNLVVLPSRQKKHVAKNRAAFIGVTPIITNIMHGSTLGGTTGICPRSRIRNTPPFAMMCSVSAKGFLVPTRLR